MEFLNNYTMQSVYFCNLTRELGCILACVGVIGELTYPLPKLGEGRVRVHSDIRNTCHAELDSASDQCRMDKFRVSRHFKRSEAIQENGDLFRLLRRFTPRNDNKKVGVECQ